MWKNLKKFAQQQPAQLQFLSDLLRVLDTGDVESHSYFTQCLLSKFLLMLNGFKASVTLFSVFFLLCFHLLFVERSTLTSISRREIQCFPLLCVQQERLPELSVLQYQASQQEFLLKKSELRFCLRLNCLNRILWEFGQSNSLHYFCSLTLNSNCVKTHSISGSSCSHQGYHVFTRRPCRTNAIETFNNQLLVLTWTLYNLCNLTHLYCISKITI